MPEISGYLSSEEQKAFSLDQSLLRASVCVARLLAASLFYKFVILRICWGEGMCLSGF